MISISVCIPAYNEEAVISATVAEAQAALARIPGTHEILVCNDGSTDATGSLLASMEHVVDGLRVLTHEQNRGHAAALETLVGAAQGEVIFHIGADQEWKMTEMIPMLVALEGGADIVIGVRLRKQYSLWRKFVSLSYNVTVALMWGKWFGDLGSIKLARATIWKSIPFRAGSAFVNAERILLAHQEGARIALVPVEHMARQSGTSSFASPTKAVAAFGDLLWFRLTTLGTHRQPRQRNNHG